MKADPYDIKTVFGFERQLFAPLFQRPYVWKMKDQWEPLRQDVGRVAEELLKGACVRPDTVAIAEWSVLTNNQKNGELRQG